MVFDLKFQDRFKLLRPFSSAKEHPDLPSEMVRLGRSNDLCPSEFPKSQPLVGQVPAFSSEGLWLLGQQKVTDHLLVPGTNFFSV